MTDKVTKRYTENSLIFKVPWHKEEFPKVDSIVIGVVSKVDDSGAEVKILDYESKRGFIAFDELSKKRVYNIRSILKVGDIKLLLVLNVDVKGYIDLSNKYFADTTSTVNDDITRFDKYSLMIRIMHQYYLMSTNTKNGEFNTEIDIKKWKELLDASIWKYPVSDCYNIFVDILNDKQCIEDVFPSIENQQLLLQVIDKNITVETEVKLILNLVTWSVDPTKTIINLLSDIKTYCLSYGSVDLVINSPTYTFTVTIPKIDSVTAFSESIPAIMEELFSKYDDINASYSLENIKN